VTDTAPVAGMLAAPKMELCPSPSRVPTLDCITSASAPRSDFLVKKPVLGFPLVQ